MVSKAGLSSLILNIFDSLLMSSLRRLQKYWARLEQKNSHKGLISIKRSTARTAFSTTLRSSQLREFRDLEFLASFELSEF